MLVGTVTNNGTFVFTNRSSGTGSAGLITGLSGSWTPVNAVVGSSGAGGNTPTGTGFVHVTGGVQDGSASTDGSSLTGIVAANIAAGGQFLSQDGSAVTNTSLAILNFGGTTGIAQQPSSGAEYIILGVSQSAAGNRVSGLNGKFRVPYSGYLTNLWADDTQGFGSGTNVVVRVFTNGVASNMSFNMNGNGTSTPIGGSNLTSSVLIPAGCYLNISFSNNSASAPANQLWMGSVGFIH